MDADRWERKRQRWEERERRRACYTTPGRHLFSGVVFLTVGMVLLLGNLGLVNAGYILRFWPVILIALGAYKLVDSRDGYGHSSGVFWIIVGSFLLAGTTGILRVAIRDLWPVFLIGLGVLMLWRSGLARRPRWDLDGTSTPGAAGPKGTPTANFEAAPDPTIETNSNSHFSGTAVLGSFERRINSQDFRGGEVTAVLGGCNIDLRGASITVPHQPIIKVFALFGGIEIRVPDDWTIVSEVELILGGFDDKKAEAPKIEEKRLIIRGSVVMGGIEVRN
jgi:predicted membrane protein